VHSKSSDVSYIIYSITAYNTILFTYNQRKKAANDDKLQHTDKDYGPVFPQQINLPLI